ncbi:hypothetical protein CL629_02000 [bacterium]|nr:hypothetical protein [bacterium]
MCDEFDEEACRKLKQMDAANLTFSADPADDIYPSKELQKKLRTDANLKRAKGKGGAYERISAAVLNHPHTPPGFKGGQKDVDELSRALGLKYGVDYRNWATLGKAILNALPSASPEKDPLGQQVGQSVQNLKRTPAPKGSGTGVTRRTGSGKPAQHPLSKYGTQGI